MRCANVCNNKYRNDNCSVFALVKKSCDFYKLVIKFCKENTIDSAKKKPKVCVYKNKIQQLITAKQKDIKPGTIPY